MNSLIIKCLVNYDVMSETVDYYLFSKNEKHVRLVIKINHKIDCDQDNGQKNRVKFTKNIDRE